VADRRNATVAKPQDSQRNSIGQGRSLAEGDDGAGLEVIVCGSTINVEQRPANACGEIRDHRHYVRRSSADEASRQAAVQGYPACAQSAPASPSAGTS
jgi:hypothetical protein